VTSEGEPSTTSGQGRPGIRWGGDGALGRPEPRPQDDPTSPLHAPPPVPEFGRRRTPAADPPYPYAPIWRRCAAFMLDALIKATILVVILFVGGVDTGGTPTSSLVLILDLFSRGYDLIFWSQGWSPGGLAFGLRIVREDGEPPGWWRALRRVIGSLLVPIVFIIGYAWALWDRRRQTWHDKLGGTFVVLGDRPR
jgi:uncharacterized RDD family membrane protein YckC